jgi:hypothetical protein
VNYQNIEPLTNIYLICQVGPLYYLAIGGRHLHNLKQIFWASLLCEVNSAKGSYSLSFSAMMFLGNNLPTETLTVILYVLIFRFKIKIFMLQAAEKVSMCPDWVPINVTMCLDFRPPNM